MHKNMIKSNQTAASVPPKTTTKQNYNNFEDFDTLHMGVAEPMSAEDIEKEIVSKTLQTATEKDGISTWILLSGGQNQNQKLTPTTETPTRTSIRHEGKIEKITKIRTSTTMKPKFKPSSSTLISSTTKKVVASIKPVELSELTSMKTSSEKPIVDKDVPIVPIRSKKPTTARPLLVTKKQVNKKTSTAVTNIATKVTPTTPTPSSTTPAVTSTTTEHEPTSTTIESTTFLIMEPKDADFDLPQDRSPGTTKKPKKTKIANKTKKNKTNGKKPTKTQLLANKDKPLTTKIYNYFAREVMPTVGVGLVGLTVAAGLATYFLAPFGALRRSYDIADRKDDMYFYNNEEYAGQDGQSEEEVFGKVIAGMPVNSPYRNTIRYNVHQSPQPQRNQIQGGRPGAKFVHYPAPVQQYRVRNVAPAGYPAVVQQQYNQQPSPVYTKRRDQYPQQFYRYNNEPSPAEMYRHNANAQLVQSQQQQQHEETPDSVQIPDAKQSDSNQYEPNNQYEQDGSYATIVTPEPYFDNTKSGIDFDKMPDDNVISKRTQFVVGTTVDGQQTQSTNDINSAHIVDETPIKEVADVVPEHGPRRRRQITSENEIDGIISDDKDPIPYAVSETILDVTTTPSSLIGIDENMMKTSTNNPTPPKATRAPMKSNIFDLIKDLFEIKVRMGLSFLQNTTMAVQRYLQSVEKRVEESNVFQNRPLRNPKKPINSTSSTPAITPTLVKE